MGRAGGNLMASLNRCYRLRRVILDCIDLRVPLAADWLAAIACAHVLKDAEVSRTG
jgi:hypothetical protein